MNVSMPPEISSTTALLVLVVARAIGLTWTAPAFSASGLEWRFKLVAGGLLGLVLAPAVGAAGIQDVAWPVLARGLLGEAVVGAALGWSASLVIAGARQAGELVGAQGGFAPAALFDPETHEEMTAFGHLYGLIALAAFIALDGPLALVRALMESFRIVPPGGGILTEANAILAFGRVGKALALAVRAASPAALALVLAGVAVGLLGKAAPSLQLVAVAMPVRAVLGLLVVLLSLGTLALTFSDAWGRWPGVLP